MSKEDALRRELAWTRTRLAWHVDMRRIDIIRYSAIINSMLTEYEMDDLSRHCDLGLYEEAISLAERKEDWVSLANRAVPGLLESIEGSSVESRAKAVVYVRIISDWCDVVISNAQVAWDWAITSLPETYLRGVDSELKVIKDLCSKLRGKVTEEKSAAVLSEYWGEGEWERGEWRKNVGPGYILGLKGQFSEVVRERVVALEEG